MIFLTTFWSAVFAITFTTTQVNGSSKKNIAVKPGVQYELSFELLRQNINNVRIVISEGTQVLIDQQNLADGIHSFLFTSTSASVILKFQRMDNDNIVRSFQVNNILLKENLAQNFSASANHLMGIKDYELRDHLGNVRVTLEDVKDNNAPYITSANDYLPFGVLAKGRSYFIHEYRYGFVGQELNDELSGQGNSLDFGARILDTRLARFFSLDPDYMKYPDYSPYIYAGNRPIFAIDSYGLGEEGVNFKSILLNSGQYLILVNPTQEELTYLMTTVNATALHFSAHNANDPKYNALDHHFQPIKNIGPMKVIALTSEADINKFIEITGIKDPALLPGSDVEGEKIHYTLNHKNITFRVPIGKGYNVTVDRYFTVGEIHSLKISKEAKTTIILDQASYYSKVSGGDMDFTSQYSNAKPEEKEAILASAMQTLSTRDQVYSKQLQRAKEIGSNPYLDTSGTMHAADASQAVNSPTKAAVVTTSDGGVQTW
ncbi:MAG: hypothetical protein NT150_01475 [Bacteroidetes bacterium]|nr:hypothetical protein [Bacteroidota bacterium]